MGQGKIVALSGSTKETAAYGKFLGKRLRHITNRDTMTSQSFGVTEIHYLPGWHKRRDRFAIASVVTAIRRKKRGTPLIEVDIVRLQDGRFVPADYRGPELEEADPVGDTQKTQLDGLRQMHVQDHPGFGADPQFEAGADAQDLIDHDEAQVQHLPQTISAEEAAEEQGIDVDTDDFLDFLEQKDS